MGWTQAEPLYSLFLYVIDHVTYILLLYNNYVSLCIFVGVEL